MNFWRRRWGKAAWQELQAFFYTENRAVYCASWKKCSLLGCALFLSCIKPVSMPWLQQALLITACPGCGEESHSISVRHAVGWRLADQEMQQNPTRGFAPSTMSAVTSPEQPRGWLLYTAKFFLIVSLQKSSMCLKDAISISLAERKTAWLGKMSWESLRTDSTGPKLSRKLSLCQTALHVWDVLKLPTLSHTCPVLLLSPC